MRRPAPLAAAAAAALALAGCGGSPGDLLALEVSGGPANRQQRLVVQTDGRATCNGGPSADIGSDPLIDAREIERDAANLAERAAVYQAARGGATSYVLHTKDGTVRWQEGARPLPEVLSRAQLFALQQGRVLCR